MRGGPFGGPRFARGPRVRRGDVRAAALSLLAEGPRNGYQIIQEISERTNGVWRPSPGSVYPALQQLEDEGLIRAETGESGRKAFGLTDEGRAYASRMPTSSARVGRGDRQRRRRGGRAARAGPPGHHGRDPGGAGWFAAQVKEAGEVLTDTRRSLYRILAADDGAEAGSPEQ